MDKNLIITNKEIQNADNTNPDDNTNPIDVGYIRVYNNSGFYIYFSLTYTLNGQTFTNNTNAFAYQSKAEIRYPKEAANIQLTIQMAIFIETWRKIFETTFETAVQKCFMVYGTVFDPKCDEIKCPLGDNGGGNNDNIPNIPTPPMSNHCCPCYCPCYCPCCRPSCCGQQCNKCCNCNPYMNSGVQMMNYPTSYNYNW